MNMVRVKEAIKATWALMQLLALLVATVAAIGLTLGLMYGALQFFFRLALQLWGNGA